MAGIAQTMEPALLDVSDAQGFLHGHPHAEYDRLRAVHPVYRAEKPLGGDPHWVLTRHADIRAVSLDTDRWTSTQGFRLVEAGRASLLDADVMDAVRQNMLLTDPPRHGGYRRPLVNSFTVRALSAIEQAVTEAVEQLLRGFRGRTEIEVVGEFAGIMPIRALCLLLGIPEEDEQRIFDWTNSMVGVSDPEYGLSADETSRIHREVFAYGRRLLDERRRDGKGDVLSVVAKMEIEGQPFLGPDLDGMIALLLAAGNETTRNSLTGAMLALGQFPEQRARLRDDPSMTNNAVEELLRFVTPVIQMSRTAKVDTVIGGEKISAGDRVVMLYGAANRDDQIFDAPHELQLDRGNARDHLAFGVGIHHCLGAHMARLQLRVALRRLLDHFPDFRAIEEPEYLQSNFVSSVKRVRFALV